MPDQQPRAVLAIGGSAGGVDALIKLVEGLQPDLPLAALVVIHFPATGSHGLPRILNRVGQYQAVHAAHGDEIRPGHIYVGPPDFHLMVQGNRIALSRGPRINRVRPAVDHLFHSCARAFGDRLLAIVLSGALDDGSVGLMAVKAHGGKALVQDPEDAEFPSMPSSAIATVEVDFVAPAVELPEVIRKVVDVIGGSREGGAKMSAQHGGEIEEANNIIEHDLDLQSRGERHGGPSVYSCPDCGGVMWQMEQSNVVRFQCHVGHAHTLQSLLVSHADELEQALWSAIRSLKEKASLAAQAIARFGNRIDEERLARYQEQVDVAQSNSDLLRRLVETGIFSPIYEQQLAEQADLDMAEAERSNRREPMSTAPSDGPSANRTG